MGKKDRQKCLVCQTEFKKQAGDQQICRKCNSSTVVAVKKIDATPPPGSDPADSTTDDQDESCKKRKRYGNTDDKGLPQGAGAPREDLSSDLNPSSPDVAATGAALGHAALDNLERRITVIESASSAGLEQALLDLKGARCVAVDCEGVAMSRTGKVTLIQVATERQVYLFDLLALGAEAFRESPPGPATSVPLLQDLKHLLESPDVCKLMYDCRRDSDSLYHQFGVRLAGVRDLQLFGLLLERTQGKEVTRLSGFARYARLWLGGKTYGPVVALKERIKAQYGEGEEGRDESHIWARRPMDIDVIRYAAMDVALLHPMQAAMLHSPVLADGMMERIEIASSGRLSEYRDMVNSPEQGVHDPSAGIAPDV